MTVREAFGKAFGEVPETHACYAGYGGLDFNYFGAAIHLWEGRDTDVPLMVPVWVGGENYEWKRSRGYGKTPDISNRPAESFRGFFGAEYDDVLDAQKEEA